MSVDLYVLGVHVIKAQHGCDGWFVEFDNERICFADTKREALAVARILRRALREARKVGKR